MALIPSAGRFDAGAQPWASRCPAPAIAPVGRPRKPATKRWRGFWTTFPRKPKPAAMRAVDRHDRRQSLLAAQSDRWYRKNRERGRFRLASSGLCDWENQETGSKAQLRTARMNTNSTYCVRTAAPHQCKPNRTPRGALGVSASLSRLCLTLALILSPAGRRIPAGPGIP